MTCPTCGDRRHIQQEGRWTRCPVCVATVLSARYIPHALRERDTTLQVSDALADLPLQGTVVAYGDWTTFRRLAWRTLLRQEPRDITHDVVPFGRLVEIHMGKEREAAGAGAGAGFTSLRDLVVLDVLVIPISTFEFSNRLQTSVFATLITERESYSRATWIFSHADRVSLRTLLDPTILDRWFSSPWLVKPDEVRTVTTSVAPPSAGLHASEPAINDEPLPNPLAPGRSY